MHIEPDIPRGLHQPHPTRGLGTSVSGLLLSIIGISIRLLITLLTHLHADHPALLV